MAKPSLESISQQYGQSELFGHQDYLVAIEAGYTDAEILAWLDEDLNRLSAGNQPGGSAGLYDEIASGSVDPTKASDINRNEPGGMTPYEYDYQQTIDLANIDKEIQDMVNQSNEYIAQIQADASTEIANVNAGATRYTATAQLAATRYVADREQETELGVADITQQGALDLQEIVNAGLTDVEEIRSESAENVATIGGEFDVQAEEIKGQTARDVAEIDYKNNLFGSLISAFSF